MHLLNTPAAMNLTQIKCLEVFLPNMNLPLVFFDHQWSATISEAGALDRVLCALLVCHGTHVVSEKYI